MKEHFVNYNQALALKELGFDEPCFGKYDTQIADQWVLNISPEGRQFQNTNKACIAPLKQQVFKWFWVYFHLSHNIFDWLDDFEITITEWALCEDRIVYEYPRFDTYEQAESACIDKLIEIIKEKKL
jgi:hypothetical protein